jgi:hypothetical protein
VTALVRGISERIIMAITIYRAGELYSTRKRRGKFPTGKSHFFKVIEPQLEKVQLGPQAVGYTDQSVDKFIEKGIAAATAERESEA